jgi:hypothetical protein
MTFRTLTRSVNECSTTLLRSTREDRLDDSLRDLHGFPCASGEFTELQKAGWGTFWLGVLFRPPTLVINTTFEAEFCQQ